MSEVAELFITSMSSATMMSARVPASWLVIPRDMTEGDWSGSAGPTSNMTLEERWPSRDLRWARTGIWSMRSMVKVVKLSARTFEAETTRIFFWGSLRSSQRM